MLCVYVYDMQGVNGFIWIFKLFHLNCEISHLGACAMSTHHTHMEWFEWWWWYFVLIAWFMHLHNAYGCIHPWMDFIILILYSYISAKQSIYVLYFIHLNSISVIDKVYTLKLEAYKLNWTLLNAETITTVYYEACYHEVMLLGAVNMIHLAMFIHNTKYWSIFHL